MHQGNGTAAIFSGDTSGVHVLDARRQELSVQEGNQRLDVTRPLDDGTGDDEYLRCCARTCLRS